MRALDALQMENQVANRMRGNPEERTRELPLETAAESRKEIMKGRFDHLICRVADFEIWS
jgi:hypothetical protein